jgi:hypothetical protein
MQTTHITAPTAHSNTRANFMFMLCAPAYPAGNNYGLGLVPERAMNWPRGKARFSAVSSTLIAESSVRPLAFESMLSILSGFSR